ncbi:MAG: 2Fe-2S iron-sulfur cluster binding domain-containing protein [Alphaproteobacteria bacterium]|nr:2Fe-2S iron-sulfur cluster binding domain-containing protein [Alphaproteobacteria bacterium]
MPVSQPRFHRLTVADRRQETADTVSIALHVPAKLAKAYRYAPGQYLTLRANLADEEVRRPYSLSSAPGEGEWRVAIKRVEGGAFSNFAHDMLWPGEAVDVMTPAGRFTTPLDVQAARTFLAVAAGSGITPVMSILKAVLAEEPRSRFTLLYGNRSAPSIIFKATLDDLKDRHVSRLAVHHILSRERPDIPLLHGHLDSPKIRLLLRTMEAAGHIDHAFLCGPAGLIDQARATLIELGVAPARIHAELFTPGARAAARPEPGLTTPAPLAASAADIRIDGTLHRVDVAASETIIEAASRAGLQLPFACKGGMCCTCRARLVAGTVDMATNYSLEPWELAAGFVLTCQSRPTSPSVELDYDQV